MYHFSNPEVEAIMKERFGKDHLLALATVEDGLPHVRTVNAYYMDGAFYIVTHAMSGKMQLIKKEPHAAVCGEWFTGHGVAENLGHVLDDGNGFIMSILRRAFSAWYQNGHVNEQDPNTCLLRINMNDGVLFHHNKRYDLWY